MIRTGLIVLAGVALLLVLALPGKNEGHATAPKQAPATAVKPEDKARPDEAKKHQAHECVSKILRGDAQDRVKAIAILRNLGEDGLAVLRETFDGDTNPRKREAAAFGLAILGNEMDKNDVAFAFLDTKDEPTALMCAAAARLKDPGLVMAFLQLRDSKDWRIREAAAVALRTDTFTDLRNLMPLLADSEPRVREAAECTLVSTLDRMPHKNVEHAVTQALASDDPVVKQTALRICNRVDGDWAVTAAVESLSDAHGSVRAEAVRVLARKGDARASGALVDLMHNGRGRKERVRAASALASLHKSPQMLDQLAAAANGPDPIVALAASRSLAAQGDTRAIEALLRLREVRKSAELNVDDEDEMLLRNLGDAVLERVQGRNKRRSNEDWKAWWERVKQTHTIPPRFRAPPFPDNH